MDDLFQFPSVEEVAGSSTPTPAAQRDFWQDTRNRDLLRQLNPPIAAEPENKAAMTHKSGAAVIGSNLDHRRRGFGRK